MEILTESEMRFRNLFEHIPIAYQSLSADGSIVDVNENWLRLTVIAEMKLSEKVSVISGVRESGIYSRKDLKILLIPELLMMLKYLFLNQRGDHYC